MLSRDHFFGRLVRFMVNQTEKIQSKRSETKIKKITVFTKWLSGETKVTTLIVRGDPFRVAGRLK